MSFQSNLNLSSTTSGPVECLGQTFPSDEARREHYLKLLAEKLKDPEFRKIEGFPIGEDEDILALSDPPYYTACPNPWIGDFMERYGRPYDSKEKYHREPFVADVREGKNHPIYNAHSYHTKVPHRAIMRYILHYTEPGDIVFDGFCGTGMTGVAAQLCGDRREVQELGYRVDDKGATYDEMGNRFSNLGARIPFINDLSTAAASISYGFNSSVDRTEFSREANSILREVNEEISWMFKTDHTNSIVGVINFVLWSDVFICPNCGKDIIFWDSAADPEKGAVRDEFECRECSAIITKRSIERAWTTFQDKALARTIRQPKQVPVLINYTVGGKRFEKRPDDTDLQIISRINAEEILEWFPVDPISAGDKTGEPLRIGVTHTHQFYSKRNLIALSKFWKRITEKKHLIPQLVLWFTSSQVWATRMNRLLASNYFKKTGGVIGQTLQGTLYFSSLGIETNAIERFRLRIDSVPHTANGEIFCVSNGSASKCGIPDCSVDYIFLDPPFGSNIMYSELNALWESWLAVKTNIKEEAIENKTQGKSLESYRQLMAKCFSEAYRILKPGRWITVEFSNTRSAVWNAIQSALGESGFVVANVSALEKTHKGFNAVTTTTAVKQDLAISAYKPDDGLEKRFSKTGHAVEGVWDFMRTHLGNLPVVRPRGGELEFIAERDPRILYDRMVAFYVGHGVPVPLSSAEFQAALAEKFPEREGMYFLPEQVTEWDKKRSQMLGVGQMSIFVEDEKSAIDWLRNHLKSRPSTYQDVQPEFVQQLGASWKKFETRPELNVLLEQNFLKYDGKGEVPSQIHSYLSSQNKDLRNLPKDDARLQMRAKDRWYVPDPAKAVDVEAVRNKRLVQEFWKLCTEAGIARTAGASAQDALPLVIPTTVKKTGRKKLKEVRTEAVRLGFKECFAAKDYRTILAIAAHLPENVIEEDEQLQMMYDMAEMRAQG
jgi:DNA modification methylase